MSATNNGTVANTMQAKAETSILLYSHGIYFQENVLL